MTSDHDTSIHGINSHLFIASPQGLPTTEIRHDRIWCGANYDLGIIKADYDVFAWS